MKQTAGVLILIIFTISCQTEKDHTGLDYSNVSEELFQELTDKYGQKEKDRITRGVNHLASIWYAGDGTEEEFSDFCIKNYIPAGPQLDKLLEITETQYEQIRGHMREVNISLDLPVTTHQRELFEIDRLFSASGPQFDPYKNKLAFALALNFPYYTQEEKEALGARWSRKKWAMVRIGDMFDHRNDPAIEIDKKPLPDDLIDYTNLYIISMDHILSPDMEILFPEGTRLNCHNGLRDEIKGLYTRDYSLVRQRMISDIVMHIIYQTIPECMIGETDSYWEPRSNRVYKKEGDEFVETEFTPEPDRRYKNLLYSMKRKMADDELYPEGSTYITRTFDSRQLSEERVAGLLESVVGAPEVADVVAILRKRLDRDLEPFDIWYPGFQSQSNYNMDKLDSVLRVRYPDPAAFQDDIPNILRRIGFEPVMADFLGNHVIVDPVPSGGHANGPQMKGAKAHLRTRFEPYGLNYKGYRIGMHEIGHTIEQNVSVHMTDHYFLKGIPGSPFTECMADLIAYRDVVGLGVSPEYSSGEKEMNALAAFWFVCEMGADALHEIRMWHWIYDNPDATVGEIKSATISTANEIWNEYFADAFGVSDIPIFSIYNHFINGSLYLHSYPLGNIVLMQLEEYFEGKDFAEEMVRMCSIGKLTPDLWMMEATGETLSSDPMLRAVKMAINNYE